MKRYITGRVSVWHVSVCFFFLVSSLFPGHFERMLKSFTDTVFSPMSCNHLTRCVLFVCLTYYAFFFSISFSLFLPVISVCFRMRSHTHTKRNLKIMTGQIVQLNDIIGNVSARVLDQQDQQDQQELRCEENQR